MKNTAARDRIAAPIFNPRITRKYTVTQGHTVYYSSTTAEEMRELCDTRAFYAESAPSYGYSCLPQLLHQRGYTSIAVHPFSGGMFKRNAWYPLVGFDKKLFEEDVAVSNKRH